MGALNLKTLIHGCLVLLSLTRASVQQGNVNDGDLESFISKEAPVALIGILNNTGAAGSLVQGADSGIVVASPSTQGPNYFYTWTRDAALTMKYLVDAYIAGIASLETTIQNYISAQMQIQIIDNPSGTFSSGEGLGEPKFYVNETAFEGSWGRPQRDGPALRATAMIAYARSLIAANHTSTMSSVIWPVISNDLNYVAQYWNQTGFDLWEEQDGSSFWTTAVQHRALVEGANLASIIDETCAGCQSEAPAILCFLQDYWNGSAIISNINLQSSNGRSGIDCNSILTSIHTYDPAASCSNSTFQPCSSYALSNHKIYVDSFRNLYPINDGVNGSSAVAVGRYPEDVYDAGSNQGGNPWYLCTTAAAEQLYDALQQWNASSSITIDSISQPFFTSLLPSLTVGSYPASSSDYAAITNAVRTYADGFASIVQKHVMNNGSLSEQYSRYDGYALSARDLTWSYAAFLTMANARNGVLPASWNSSSASDVSQCGPLHVSSATGSYSTPSATTFPTGAGSSTKGAVQSQAGSGSSATQSSFAERVIKPYARKRDL